MGLVQRAFGVWEGSGHDRTRPTTKASGNRCGSSLLLRILYKRHTAYVRHSTSGSEYGRRLRLMAHGLKPNESASKKCPKEAQCNRRESFSRCSEQCQVNFPSWSAVTSGSVDNCLSRQDAPFAFVSTTQSRRRSLPSPRSYESPFPSNYPQLTAFRRVSLSQTCDFLCTRQWNGAAA